MIRFLIVLVAALALIYLIFTAPFTAPFVAGVAGFFTGLLAWTALAFAVGTWPFWLLFAIVFCIAWYFEESKDDGVLAIVPFAVFCLFVHFVLNVNVWTWVKENWTYVWTRASLYLILGFAYATARWVIHLRAKAHEIDELEDAFRRANPFDGSLENASEEIRYNFTEYLKGKYCPDINVRHYYDPFVYGIRPLFTRNTTVMFRRFWWWPFSLLGWIANDFIREIINAVQDLVQKALDKLSKMVFGKRTAYVVTGEQAEKIEYERRKREWDESQSGVSGSNEPFPPHRGVRSS